MDSAGGAGGRFGTWVADEHGLPAFDYAAGPDAAGLVVPGGDPSRPWHQVANAGITATADAGGRLTLYATARGFVRLTGPGCGWGIAGRPRAALRTRFGAGYARWEATPGDGRAHVTRRVSAPPGGAPALRIDVTVTCTAPVVYEERLDVRPYPLVAGGLMSPYRPPPTTHRGRARWWWRALFAASAASRVATAALRRAAARRLAVAPAGTTASVTFRARRRRRLRPRPPRRRPAWFDATPPAVWLGLLDAGGGTGSGTAVDATTGSVRVALPAGTTRLLLAVGLPGDRGDEAALAAAVRAAPPAAAAREQRARFAASIPGHDDLSRGAAWHAASLVGAEVHDDWFGARYVTQGSAYAFVHGVQGAPRDYALASVPLAFVDPPAARDVLRVVMRMTRPSGEMFYAHTGSGRCTSGGVHAAPTDLPLFLCWAVTEYVWATGDRAFLDARLPFAGAGASSVAERVLLAFRYLQREVGTGPHGMLRAGSGDWSDPIGAMVPDRRAFRRSGESSFNTAFAAYALPRAAALLDDRDAAAAAEMRALAGDARAAIERSWAGEWFLRGWDGTGRPIGDRHLFLDGQVWPLIAGIGSDAQRAALVHAIAGRCDEPSPIGATILDRPHPVRFGMLADGWDVNGGVWAAINALLAWGYARHDPARAWRSLERQSLAAHARAYPHVWYGVWSGPDAYNAHFGDRPGETFVQPATPMTEFPVMNSNAHAGPLLALLRVLGIEAEPGGVAVRPPPGGRGPAWTLTTALGAFGGRLPA